VAPLGRAAPTTPCRPWRRIASVAACRPSGSRNVTERIGRCSPERFPTLHAGRGARGGTLMHDEGNGSDAMDDIACPLAVARRASGASAPMVDCRRRALVACMAQGLLTMPVGVLAQPAGKMYRIGYLSPGAPSQGVSSTFREALKDLGYSEGRN